MITNSTITVFNRRKDDDGKEELVPTVIHGVSWHEAKETSGGQGGGRNADNADRFKVRIPVNAKQSGKTYIDSYDYRNMSDYRSSKYWTLQKEDVVIRGAYYHPVAIPDSSMLFRMTDEVFLINSYADNTIRGSRAVKHWRIGGS